MKVPYSGGLAEVLNSFETFTSKSCATTLKLSTSDLNRFDTCETHRIHVKDSWANCKAIAVNKEEEEEEEVEEEITTIMQSSTAMQQSCTHAQSNCFFPVNKEEEDKNKQEEDEIKTTVQY